MLKKIARLLAIGVFFLCAAAPVFSQINLQPAYVLTTAKDTLHGFIDFKKWENNPKKIQFRTSETAKTVTYSPTEILEFKVKDEVYVSAIVQIETSSRNINELDDIAILHFQTDTAFLQVVYRGSKSLFYYKTADAKVNFYTGSDGKYEYLTHKLYLQKVDGNLFTNENKQYQNQLVLYLNDCPDITTKIYNSQYEIHSLQKLFKAYDECMNAGAAYRKATDKVHVEIGALLGLSLTNLKFKGPTAFDYLTKANYKVSINATAAVFFDIVFPRNNSKWSINNELMYAAYKVAGIYTQVTNSTQSKTTETEVGNSLVKMNNMLRYKLPVGNAFMFFNTGFSTGFVVQETNTKIIRADFYDQHTETKDKAVPSTRILEGGLLLGMGARYQHFSFETRYEVSNGTSGITSLKSTAGKWQFLVGYKF